MKSENIKEVTNQAIEQLVAALNLGHSEALQHYLRAMARFRTYSFLNVLLILKACPKASRVAGYSTWRSFGRQVKQGEKGIKILAPMFRKREDSTESSEASPTKNGERLVSGFRPVYVWDEQQTTGKELPEVGHVIGDPSFYLERLEEFTKRNSIALQYSDSIAPAKGMAEKGKITLLPGQTAAETFSTLVHELAHGDLHFGARRAETTKRIRETEAESVAYVVCTAIGLNPGTSSGDYIGLYGGDSKLLVESLEYVRATASRILDGIEAVPQRQAA